MVYVLSYLAIKKFDFVKTNFIVYVMLFVQDLLSVAVQLIFVSNV